MILISNFMHKKSYKLIFIKIFQKKNKKKNHIKFTNYSPLYLLPIWSPHLQLAERVNWASHAEMWSRAESIDSDSDQQWSEVGANLAETGPNLAFQYGRRIL